MNKLMTITANAIFYTYDSAFHDLPEVFRIKTD